LHKLLLKDAKPDSETGDKALTTVSGFQLNIVDEKRANLPADTHKRAGLWIYITLLADKVMVIGGDNTACLCWLIKPKATNFMADRILKITSLLCYRFHVQIKNHKIAGKVLFQPDWLSRAQGISNLDPPVDFGPVNNEDHFFEMIADGCNGDYNKLCRIVLQRCLMTNSFVSFAVFIPNSIHNDQICPQLPTSPQSGNHQNTGCDPNQTRIRLFEKYSNHYYYATVASQQSY
jgi:hypothetical protein